MPSPGLHRSWSGPRSSPRPRPRPRPRSWGHGSRSWGRPGPMSRSHRYFTPYYNYYLQPWVPTIQSTDLDEPARVPPMHWIGKYFVRSGYLIPSNIPQRDIILEDSIFDSHEVIGPNDMSYGYNPDRLLIYINGRNRIENVRFG